MLVVSAIYGRRGDVSAARSTRLCKYENDAGTVPAKAREAL